MPKRKPVPEQSEGFTLVELLVVIAIIAVLSVIGLAFYGKLTARARDVVRLSDLGDLSRAIVIAMHDSEDYKATLCQNTSLPCQGSSYPLLSDSRNTDGTGWVKVDFDNKNGINFSQLPIDPTNDSTYNYIYMSDGTNWKMEAVFESDNYKHLMQDDGGSDPEKYEVGSRIRQY